MAEELRYQSGFGNHLSSEASPGALPQGQNSPQRVKYGLYAEQLSGSAFTAPREENARSWLYRILPSVVHSPYRVEPRGPFQSSPFRDIPANPNQMRWDPLPLPTNPTDFLRWLVTWMGNGNLTTHRGCAVHLYAMNQVMGNSFFYNSDGEFLFVPYDGGILLRTEFGIITVSPGEIAVIPKGIKYQCDPLDKVARGYICENYGRSFRLPPLGPIGGNGLANPRDFLSPTAFFEDKAGNFVLFTKFQGELWKTSLNHHPLDVVAWHGNYCPYKYDLGRFNAINTVSFDHPDPSIYTVLTSPSDHPGTANVDFVIFPPRWLVAEHTFRPPYYHRNCMSEYMGLIQGVYDAKTGGGFVPGGGSLHNCMSPHGPDAQTFEKALGDDLKPQFIGETLAFMFESSMAFRLTSFSANTPLLQKDYLDCWKGLKSHFDPKGASQ